MDINWASIFFCFINLLLLFLIIIGIFKVVKNIKIFINRNKEIEKKIDTIINNLEDN
ncbi:MULTISPECIES: hypothetical protein [Clostridium]|uniref:DUF4083 domain-containing protein n=1 Tax=Clostridium sporogenes TaxID=1509 RepID=A0A7U4XSU8_CLOSG|nr:MULTISPECIES: hypothetical protein [Clostridium]AJD30318.1 hypothetical protein T258_3003 [Clostridium botulinum Prevot_594]AKC61170.1 hypothetical protein CLSPO_c04400 [Clostridium sporogenes]EHN16937.1 hypothetical protein IYC_01334 [Clostridium sporogenes PA 3679]KCZ69916.1 hypothetical protein CSPO_1c00080 [Clostridium sporogenes]KRU43816.1 hypothetical protein VT94_12830 [Clostridium sporogenes]